MAKRTTRATATRDSGATVGYEAQLWKTANALRGSMKRATEAGHPQPVAVEALGIPWL